MSWVKPVFNSEEDEGAAGTSVDRVADQKIDAEKSDKKWKISRGSTWVDRYGPTDVDQLAVHVKKVKEFEEWIMESVVSRTRNNSIALLVGPSGSGKTATLLAVAQKMKCTVKEWLNPTIHRPDSGSTSGQGGSTNQVDQFEDFLFRASRYQDLFGTEGRKTLLLVEDIPNVFIRDSSLLEASLRKYVEVGRCPLVFICTNGSNDFNLERMLFKPHMITELQITSISFNPINKTLMCKALERILKAAKRDNPDMSVKGTKCVEDTAAIANGDIRFAVNHLQFLLSGEEDLTYRCTSHEETLPKSEALKRIEPTTSAKDKSADIFRCLGAVLYNKKETVIDPNTGVATKRPTHDPEEISSKMSSVPNLFHGLLTENYLGVMNDMNSISEACELLSLTDVMMSGYWDCEERDIHKTYAVNVAVHGLMNLPSNQAQRKFYPFKGSKLKEVNALVSERLKKCRDLFPVYRLQSRTFLAEICPFVAQSDMRTLSSDQKNFILEVTESTSVSSRSSTKAKPARREDGTNGEAIQKEIEVIDLEPPIEVVTAKKTEEVEVISIEEFSDDDDIVMIEEL